MQSLYRKILQLRKKKETRGNQARQRPREILMWEHQASPHEQRSAEEVRLSHKQTLSERSAYEVAANATFERTSSKQARPSRVEGRGDKKTFYYKR